LLRTIYAMEGTHLKRIAIDFHDVSEDEEGQKDPR
jgi:hypothetical protein